MKLLILTVGSFLLIIACSAAIQIQPVKVEGIAMEPALKDGDRILINRRPAKLERGDIVVFYYPADQTKSFIKRIIGLPNETVEIHKGQVMINGKVLAEPYVEAKNNQAIISGKAVTLPEDEYYVMGDNRDNSNDSRMWGGLQRNFIYGKFESKYLSK
ncbi:MAG TPA: signal peptidase I [Pyrinomonadaceae bacterium]|jgi:signal peptidase I|nr:signal peptidase I [Pyrinomonadaceae bacterium]